MTPESPEVKRSHYNPPVRPKINDGGPAFARPGSENVAPQTGISYRQWLVGKIVAALIIKFGDDDCYSRDDVGVEACRVADAVIAAEAEGRNQ